jgi:hypothetical protein
LPRMISRSGCKVGMHDAITTTSASILPENKGLDYIEIRDGRSYLVHITRSAVPSFVRSVFYCA